MTELTFDTPKDSVPPESGAEYSCQYCGTELYYGGRGRKPVKCTPNNGGNPECEAYRGSKTSGGKAKKTPNTNIAREAARTLYQMNATLGLASLMFGYAGTASAIASANEEFEDVATLALEADPALCKMILAGGTNSSKLMLLMAYVGFGSKVVPTLLVERQARKAQKAEQAERELEELAA